MFAEDIRINVLQERNAQHKQQQQKNNNCKRTARKGQPAFESCFVALG